MKSIGVEVINENGFYHCKTLCTTTLTNAYAHKLKFFNYEYNTPNGLIYSHRL
jgi:hypothetical protein